MLPDRFESRFDARVTGASRHDHTDFAFHF
jgi:hypothetical protein